MFCFNRLQGTQDRHQICSLSPDAWVQPALHKGRNSVNELTCEVGIIFSEVCTVLDEMAIAAPHGTARLNWGWRLQWLHLHLTLLLGQLEWLGTHQASLSSKVFRLLTGQLLSRGLKGTWPGLFEPSKKETIPFRPILPHSVLKKGKETDYNPWWRVQQAQDRRKG